MVGIFRNQQLSLMDHGLKEFFYFPGPSMPRLVSYFLKITFQMLQAFYVVEFKSVMVIDGVVIMHDGGGRRKGWKDVIFHNTRKVLFHVSTVECEVFIAIKAKAGARCMDEYYRVIPIEPVRCNAGSTDFLDKGGEFAGEAFLKFAQIAIADSQCIKNVWLSGFLHIALCYILGADGTKN